MKKPAKDRTKTRARTAKPAPVPVAALNQQQQKAVEHGRKPLLIIAGAGTGKTMTLGHRVAHLIAQGVEPQRILLLTFTRKAAEELLRRVENLLHPKGGAAGRPRVWGGTFHAVGARFLRMYAPAVGREQTFTILDRDDSEEFLDILRTEMKLTEERKDFPKKGTCQTIHSGWINSGKELDEFIAESFSWVRPYRKGLEKLFDAYAARKEKQNVFDFDDLLLYWNRLFEIPKVGEAIRARFDCVLVDEYQDTNVIQAQILANLRPDGAGLTVVGDDAQSIYSFRGATVRNILDFPKGFPGTKVLPLEDNYRSTTAILDASNQVIAQATEGYSKKLRSTRKGGELPRLVSCSDEYAEASYVVEQIVQHHKAGMKLSEQAVLFRASHHSLSVEMELSRRKISFHKYGGLKFADAAHVKDLTAFLRLSENPRDLVSGRRVLQLLPGIGPKKAQTILDGLLAANGDLGYLSSCKLPPKAAEKWGAFVKLVQKLAGEPGEKVAEQMDRVLKFYLPLLRETYDDPQQRIDDLKKLHELATRFEDRTSFLAEFTLDPPTSTSDLARAADTAKDFLVLSTIHSAKGLEWDAVYVINATEGGIPSHRATGVAQLDEELRLFYVALTRAKTHLSVTYPRYRASAQSYWSSGDDLPQLTRFLPGSIQRYFEKVTS